MNILYRCDQCTHEEWREEGQEPWLCVVCGYMRWQAIATEAELSQDLDLDGGNAQVDEILEGGGTEEERPAPAPGRCEPS